MRPSLSDRLFRAVLRLFPSGFRGDFGDDMAADFRDQRLETAGAEGRLAVARLWVRTLADIAGRAPREQAADLCDDARFAGRMMRRYPVSTAVIVLLLALGLGANVAVLSFADPLLRRPLPVPGGDALVRIVRIEPSDGRYSHPFYRDVRERATTFDVAAHVYTTVAFGLGEGARALAGELVSGNYFDLLRVQPALGRLIQPHDDVSVGGHPVVVLSHGAWRELGGAPDAIGGIVHINGHPFEVIGVAPESFPGSYTAFASRFWVPITMYREARPQDLPLDRRGWGWLSLTGRVRPGATTEDASTEANRIAAELQRQYPTSDDPATHAAVPARGLPESTQDEARTVVLFAGAISALLLIVTCANVAGVLHSRAAARIRETAVRYALGATRLRVARQWLTESLVIGLAGAAAGLVAGRWIQQGLTALLGDAAPVEIARPAVASLRIVAATGVLAIVASLMFGLLPAWRAASRGEQTLREHGHALTGSRRTRRSTRLLVVVQVAVSLALMVTAGLLTLSLRNAALFDPGFETRALVVANLNLRRHGYDQARAAAFFDRLSERLRARGEIAAVTRAVVVPLGGEVERLGFRIPGFQPPGGRTAVSIDVNAVGDGYFETLGIPIVRGRGFLSADGAGAAPVAVVNETMAARFWPGRDAIGQTIELAGEGHALRVVGVARDIKYYALDEPSRPYVYAKAEQMSASASTLHVRAAGTPAAAIAALKNEVRALDSAVLVEGAMTFEELRQQPLLMRRAMMVLAQAFGLVALLLTLVGIYGTMANAVGQRAREIGVRLAFGATMQQVYRMVVSDGLVPVLVGLVLGVLGSGVLVDLVSGELFGVSPTDPRTHVAAAAAVLLAAVAALSIPAARAARLDPVAILRE